MDDLLFSMFHLCSVWQNLRIFVLGKACFFLPIAMSLSALAMTANFVILNDNEISTIYFTLN